jgi:ABC-type oligopeptide transport system substrate-binding subunit
VTAGDFVFSWRRQLDPRNGAAYAGFLFDIKNAERFNTSTANDDGTYTDAEGNPFRPRISASSPSTTTPSK